MPAPPSLKQLTKSLAMLDALIQREWEYRYYSFDSKWADYGEMASMRNGQGDGWSCVFGSGGVFLKGFDHESEMSALSKQPPNVWPGVLDSVPSTFKDCLLEPAFSMVDTTFCIWRLPEHAQWKTGRISYPAGDDPDGSGRLLSILDANPDSYKKWADEYYERSISLTAIQQIYEGTPLTPELVRELNPDVQFASLLGDAAEIAYPTA